jgi:hypothetical protein
MLRNRIKNRVKNILAKAKFEYRQKRLELKLRNSPKIFGIGNNKTGTTSLMKAMSNLGFEVGDQRTAEMMYKFWAQRNFAPIIKYCKSAEFFQDFPFSKAFTYIVLDQAFPNSKFILTVRDDPDQWYNSLTKFHAKLWGKNGRIPTREDLENSNYIFKGRSWEMNRLVYTTPEENPYQKDILVKSYIDYNNSVIEYFRHRPNDLLILNVSEEGAYRKLCEFVDKPVNSEDFPWENKT